ncbi:uncharacterized protein UBRO2_05199 [Ustilago bromivora]|uniref:Uncharacterized protein n=1 Tax=Ustilago bromivora TaxID=307758 RepID=A0A8H8QS90_9BASI|nr:uncharacterized protein UBRO2_05199 [Ustilago bromivora]
MSTRNTTTSRKTSASTSNTGSHANQDDREWTQTMSSDESEPGSSNNDSDSDVQWAMYIVQGHTEAEADVLVYRDLASFGDPAAENSRETGIADPTEATPPGQSSSPATSSVPVNGLTNHVQNPDNGWIYNDVRTNS